jgi:transcriptional regulator with XRE-family HTH domain
METLIQQFIERRRALGLTQEEVNARMGNADRLVSKWECGDRTPTSFNLYCWAEALHSSILLQVSESALKELQVIKSCKEK